MKKVLVTGASGFIGKNLVLKLLKKNYSIYATFHKNKNLIKNKKIKYFKVDLRKTSDCKKITKNIDIVCMCAANSSGAKIMKENPLEHLNPNIRMNINMLEASYVNNVKKFIFISSNAVYPETKKSVVEKDSKYSFFDGYYIAAWMKKFSEIVCEIYSKRIKKKMITLIIRPGNLYGPHDKFDVQKSKVIPSLIRKIHIKREKNLVVWGDGKDLKDFLYIDDFIDALVKCINFVNYYTIINIASGKSITIKKILKILIQLTKKKKIIQYDKSQPSMIPARKININKAKKILKWKPKTSLSSGLKKTIEYYNSNNLS
jgi:GDP-L-fucose synthase